ncbi:ABC transporter substrate-binding protein [Tomitella gaofuii]|uniref:ABC transporter substrate-binding protein n=1 Tax=Tomitella gaofuii TaxID=2760083 RepID=UPI0015F9C50F|nr:ABC transporter substrate-binding protein [Tomitella gaofuii]
MVKGIRRQGIRRGAQAAAVFCGAALVLTGCVSAGSDGGATAATTSDGEVTVGIIGDQPDGGDPVDGGVLRFASYAPVRSLDPVKTQASGTTGGTELAAVYDVLVRYDAVKDEYEPRLAESLEESDDGLTWTLKLRDGITFSDGTPLDAAAVVASTERYNRLNGPDAQVFTDSVASVEAKDPSTVVYTLNQPWHQFPAMLSLGHGMIVAPSAGEGADFTPIGAGPFTVESLGQNELKLVAREDYWDGAPHLDGLSFVTIAGEKPKIDSLANGDIEMAYLRDPTYVAQAKQKFPGYLHRYSLTDQIQLNSRPGRPGADERIRQAVQYALDPEAVNQRVDGGVGDPGTEIFPEWSKWHDDAQAAPTFDPDKARALVEEAKADGAATRLTYVSVQDDRSKKYALTAEAMLENVGLTVDIDFVPTVTDMVRRLYVDHDYDIGYTALSLPDAAPYIRLYSALSSASTNNSSGYHSEQMDALLAKIQQAPDEDAKRAAFAELQQQFTEHAPMVPMASGSNFVAWSPNVYGVTPTMDSVMLFDEAWIKK